MSTINAVVSQECWLQSVYSNSFILFLGGGSKGRNPDIYEGKNNWHEYIRV